MKAEEMGTAEATTETPHSPETVALRRLWFAGRWMGRQKFLTEEQATVLKEAAVSLNKAQSNKRGLSRREKALIEAIGILLDVIVGLLKKKAKK